MLLDFKAVEQKEHHVTSERVWWDPERPKGISREGSKGISVDQVRDPEGGPRGYYGGTQWGSCEWCLGLRWES